MERVKINIRDKNFVGDDSSCHKSDTKYIEWIRDNTPVSTSVFITDLCLPDILRASKSIKRKIAWILEPRAIHPQVYNWIEQNNRLFDYVLTFDGDLINKGENYLYYPHGRCWIPKNHPTIGKIKKVSIIASSKNYTIGHKLRHEVIQKLAQKHNIDVYGYGYKPIENKTIALDDYEYSITIENSIQPGYWTEKVVDCFATKTVPLFWGDRSINKHFREDGIIYFNDIDHLDKILSNNQLSYNTTAVDDNHKLVEKYRVPEDWIFENYPWLFV